MQQRLCNKASEALATMNDFVRRLFLDRSDSRATTEHDAVGRTRFRFAGKRVTRVGLRIPLPLTQNSFKDEELRSIGESFHGSSFSRLGDYHIQSTSQAEFSGKILDQPFLHEVSRIG